MFRVIRYATPGRLGLRAKFENRRWLQSAARLHFFFTAEAYELVLESRKPRQRAKFEILPLLVIVEIILKYLAIFLQFMLISHLIKINQDQNAIVRSLDFYTAHLD